MLSSLTSRSALGMVLPGVLVGGGGLLLLGLALRALMAGRWVRVRGLVLAELTDMATGLRVKLLLLLLWGALLGLLGMLFMDLSQQRMGGPLSLLLLGLCALPKVLTYCVAALVTGRGGDGRRTMSFEFIPGPLPDLPIWDVLVQQVQQQWYFEMRRTQAGMRQVMQHAGFSGFVASVALTCCALLLAGRVDARPIALPVAMALTVAAAVAVSFCTNLGRVLGRAAHRDGSSRMFAWATRSQLLVIVATVLLLTLLFHEKTDLISSPEGFVMIGVFMALFGERTLPEVADRAAKALGLPALKLQSNAEMQQIAGLSEEDQNRLAEEGIDTLHALAFAPTARLYFGTTYSLPRICEWQDQALLLILMGPKAQLFREQLMVRGAMAAQLVAERILEERGRPKTDDREDLVKLLGFGSLGQAREALRALREDEVVRRLRVFWGGAVRRIDGVPLTSP